MGDGMQTLRDGGNRDGMVITTPDGAVRDTGPGGCMMEAPDDPDPANHDANCDGIDGNVARAVFVAEDGVDTNPGTRESPLRSIRAGLAAAQRGAKTQVLVSRGMYPEPMTLSLVAGIGIYGGYDRRANWSRGDFQVIVLGGQLAVEGRGLQMPTPIARVEIRSADAVMPGTSSVVLRAVDSPGISVTNGAILTAGRGAAGANGMAGDVGTAGTAGGGGGNGANDNQGSPGAGGTAGVNNNCAMANGGAGGGGGRDPNFTGGDGSPAASGATGGRGAMANGCTPRSGDNGTGPATDGTDGTAGMGGAAVGSISMDMMFNYTPTSGTAGGNGAPGGGGGGGAGGSGQTGLACIDGAGNGGGGGGSGGCGGRGATGGMGGGASIAVLLVRSAATLANCQINTGGGGAGGAGGAGGMGGTGGSGAMGGNAAPLEIGSGGRGADGRRGGNGGPGGGDGGGPSIGIWIEGPARPMLDTVNYRLGNPGVGGASPGAGMGEGRRGQSVNVFPM